jgi:acylphosphatase
VNKLVKLIIRGKVHGVGFRFSCMEAAYRFGISGYVKNKSDGTVYVEAEGPEEELNRFIDWCHKGPTWAKVLKVDVEIGELKHYKSFEIAKR